jgi:Glycosyl transferase family 2
MLGNGDSSENSFRGAIRVVRHTTMIDGGKRSVSVVVPTYGNEQGLEPLVTDILETLQRENRTFEILFVNDGSPDATWKAPLSAAAGPHWLR